MFNEWCSWKFLVGVLLGTRICQTCSLISVVNCYFRVKPLETRTKSNLKQRNTTIKKNKRKYYSRKVSCFFILFFLIFKYIISFNLVESGEHFHSILKYPLKMNIFHDMQVFSMGWLTYWFWTRLKILWFLRVLVEVHNIKI